MSKALFTLLWLLLAAALPSAAAELKILNVPRTSQFVTLDPVRQLDIPSSDLINMVYSRLLAWSYLDRPYRLEPDLLVRMPELSADGLTYTFELRRGVRFIDDACFPGGKGRELTSDDVLYTLRRFADGRLNAESWFELEGAVVGLDDFHAASLKAAPTDDLAGREVAGLRKIDAQRFSIRLTRANPRFLTLLANSQFSIVPMEAVRHYKDQFGVHPVGTGAFTLRDIERKGVLHLLKNPNYYGVYPSSGAPGDKERGLLKDAGRKLPLVDGVDMPLIEEAQPAALKFLKGELDWRALDRANFTKLVKREGDDRFRLSDEYAGRFNLYWTLGLDLTFYGINQKDPLLGQNKKLRQALARLIDPQAYIDVLLNGRGKPLASVVPIEVPGSERETGATGFKYDPVEARRLLAEAGYPNGKGLPPITVSIGGATADARLQMDQMKAKAAVAGVQLVGDFTDWPTFIKALDGGKTQVYSLGWTGGTDAADYYQLLFGKNLAPGPNSGSFINAEYDRAFEAARYLPDGPQRIAFFKTMNAILVDEAPLIPVYNSLRFGITQKWLLNFKRNVQASEFMYLDLDLALKKKGLP